jgi:hypothetical protein
MLRSFSLIGCIAALGMSADAATISGNMSGTVATPSDNSQRAFVHEGGGTDALAWGTPHGKAKRVEHGNSSVLSVDGGAFNYDLTGAGEVLLGSISWDNQSNWHTGGTWNSALSLSLSLNTATGVVTRVLPLGLTVVNTTDATGNTNLNEKTGINPDSITGFLLDSTALGGPVDLGNGYRLTGVFFRLDVAGTPGTVASFTHNGVASGSQYNESTGLWESREGAVSRLGLYGFFAADPLGPVVDNPVPTTPVPVPAGALLLLSGLAVGAVVARRAKRTT